MLFATITIGSSTKLCTQTTNGYLLKNVCVSVDYLTNCTGVKLTAQLSQYKTGIK